MTEFTIEDKDLTSLEGKVIIVTGMWQYLSTINHQHVSWREDKLGLLLISL